MIGFVSLPGSMTPTTIFPAVPFNWYDVVVLLALLYGLRNGIRTGLSGELLRVLGLLLSVVIALYSYPAVGARLRAATNLDEEPANLFAFIGIAAVAMALSLIVREILRRRTRKLLFSPAVENIGGGLAGLLRMVVLIGWLTVVLALTRSQFWHKQVARDSQFGKRVVHQFPAVEAVTQKEFPESLWFLEDLKRPNEPSIEVETKHK